MASLSATVKPDGTGDYTSLAAAMTGENPTSSDDVTLTCSAGDCGAVDLDSYAFNSVTITSDSADRHDGTYPTWSSVAHIQIAANTFAVDLGDSAGVTLEHMAIRRASGSIGFGVRLGPVTSAYSPGARENIIDSCLFVDEHGSGSSMVSAALASLPGASDIVRHRVWNSVFIVDPSVIFAAIDPCINLRYTFFGSGTLVADAEADNNTILFNVDGFYGSGSSGISMGYAAISDGPLTFDITQYARNNISFFENGTPFNYATASINGGGGPPTIIHSTTFSHNASNSGAGSNPMLTGTGCLTSQTPSSWVLDEQIDARLAVGSPGEDAGTALSSFSDDIVNTSRPVGSSWDMGAFEGVASLDQIIHLIGDDLFGEGMF